MPFPQTTIPATSKFLYYSIVFVHGLTGDCIETWTYHNKSSGTTVCWPEDLLPSDIGGARIVTFGYDADVAHFWEPVGLNNLFQHADSLVSHLANLRRKTKTVQISVT
jgi:hypothetical protein